MAVASGGENVALITEYGTLPRQYSLHTGKNRDC